MLSFVMTMSPMVFFLMDHSLKSHQVAQNNVRRMQSYYLAKSGLNFTKLILYYNKQIQEQLAKSTGSSSVDLGGLTEPLYRQIPLDTLLLKSLLEATSVFKDPGDEDGEGSSGGLSTGFNAFQRDKAKEFLSFDGNFRAEVIEENAKYSVNAVSKIETGSGAYDLHKKILLGILMNPELESLFGEEEQETAAEELVHQIADYVDSNNAMNEFDQVERGFEGSRYSDLEHKPKNGKFLTLSELRLIPDMTDPLFRELESLVTVYHSDPTINICLADEKVVEQLVMHFTEYSGCTTALTEEDEEEIDQIVAAVLGACPGKEEVAAALNLAVGLTDEDGSSETTTTTTSSSSSSTSSSSTSSSATKIDGCEVHFIDLISEENEVFTVEATGQVGDIQTTLKTVIDTASSKASSWPYLYYQVR